MDIGERIRYHKELLERNQQVYLTTTDPHDKGILKKQIQEFEKTINRVRTMRSRMEEAQNQTKLEL